MNESGDSQITTAEPTPNKHLRWVIIFVLLSVHVGLLIWSALAHSPNMNEPCHMVAGLAHWKLGRYDLYNVNPPLVRMIATLPVLVAGTDTDWSNLSESPFYRSEFTVGADWVAANGPNAIWLMALARFACIPFRAYPETAIS